MRAYKPVKVLEYIILGAFAYGALYCINVSILTQGGYLATTLMALGLFYNIFLVFYNSVFRNATSKNTRVNALKTLVQIICIWCLTLVFLPMLILKTFNTEIIPQSGFKEIFAILLFITFSILGLASAFTMVKEGEGTPLPIDQTNKLVISGPYKYVRNPMAIAGVVQGIAISILYASVPVLIYAILGGVLWHLAVRPAEEKNMSTRFGKEYDAYRKKVPCWIPKINALK